MDRISHGYKLGYHKAAKMAAVSQRITVEAFTEMQDETLASLFITPVHNLQDAIEEAIQRAIDRGIREPKVLILPDGCVTVPELEPLDSKKRTNQVATSY